MFNNFFENQAICNTLSTKKLVQSSYHEKVLVQKTISISCILSLTIAENLHFGPGGRAKSF